MSLPDLGIAVRHLLKSPGFTFTAVLMLAVAIGATTAVFSIVEAVLLRPLPFPQSERLVSLADILQGADFGGSGDAGVTAPDIRAYTHDTHSFESLGGYRATSFELSGTGEPAQLPATGGSANTTSVVDGFTPPKGNDMNLATPIQVAGEHPEAMGIPLITGRRLTSSDTADTQLVALINRKFAEPYWPNADPLGKRFRTGTPDTATPWITIVGEVADVKESSPDRPSQEQWYQPVGQFEKSIGPFGSPTNLNGNSGFITLRTALEPEQMSNELQAALRSMDPLLPLTQIQSMESALTDSEAPRRFQTSVISAFALAGLVLAALGIYSVVAFSAALRAQEMAIRMALGPQRSGILGWVFLSAAELALTGCAIGLIATAAASRLRDSLLFAVSPFDPLVLSLAAVFVIILGLVASLLPAARTASINPMSALRAE